MDVRAPAQRESLAFTLTDGALVLVHPFPHEPTFARDIGRTLAELRESPLTETQLLVTLRDALRSWYPRIEIQPRNPFAGLIPQEHVWYALRDGRVSRVSDQTNRLHRAMSNARETSAESRAAVEHAREAIDFAGRPRSSRRREPVPAGMRASGEDEANAPRGDDAELD